LRFWPSTYPIGWRSEPHLSPKECSRLNHLKNLRVPLLGRLTRARSDAATVGGGQAGAHAVL
jgi:hypothetical protein